MNQETAIERIALVRPDNIGDVVLFSGTLKWIRSRFPRARITAVIKESIKGLLELCPHMDEIASWDHLSGLEWVQKLRVRGIWRIPALLCRPFVSRQLRSALLLVPVRSPNTGFFGIHGVVSSIPARERVGIKGDWCNQTPEEDRAADSIYSRRMLVPQEDLWTHELTVNRKFLEFLGVVGLKDPDVWPEFWTNDEDTAFAAEAIPGQFHGVTIGIFPSANAMSRQWPPQYIARALELARLHERYRLRLVVFGAERREAWREILVNGSGGKGFVNDFLDLRGRTTLRQLVECVKRCDGLLGTESGGMHIATALRKPTVVIMGGGHFGRFYPWGDPSINRVGMQYVLCYRCDWHCSQSSTLCIQEIRPETVSRELRIALRNAGFLIQVSQQEIDESEHQTEFLVKYLGQGSPWAAAATKGYHPRQLGA